VAVRISRGLSRPNILDFIPLADDDATPFFTRPNARGEFALFMEPGCYLWTVTPAGGDAERLPVGFGTVEVQPIASPTTGLTQRLTIPLVIPDGVTLTGTVRLPPTLESSERPAPAATIRAFAEVIQAGSVEVGQTTTDARGNFRLRLPIRQSPTPARCDP